jgi:hypothetical protein
MDFAFFMMNPYMTMASDAMYNASSIINASAQDFMSNQWPVWVNHTSMVWNHFQKDPSNLIVFYPLALFFLAFLVLTKAPATGGKYIDPDDIMSRNIIIRQRPILVVQTMKPVGDHHMVRRSQVTKYYEFD